MAWDTEMALAIKNTARKAAKSKTWKVGMQAAAILQGSELLVLDSL